MKTIEVHDPLDWTPVACKGCRKPIYWTTVVKSGRRMCFDALEVVKRTPLTTVLNLERNHWATCSHRAQFTKS